MQLLYPHDLEGVTGLGSVQGTYTIEEALARLLAGTNLSSGLTKSGVIVISQKTGDEPQGREVEEPMKVDKKTLLGAAAAFLLGGGQPAIANEVVVESNENDTEARFDPVLVTAEKREESAQSLPIAISAFSGAGLEQSGVEDMYSLPFWLRAFRWGGFSSNTFVSIRGIGSEVPSIGGESGVAIS